MFSPVDPNQLVCAEVDGVFVVDIRKPKRLVKVYWKTVASLLRRNLSDFFFSFSTVFCTIYLPIKNVVVSDTITMAVVCCVH